MAKKKMEVDHWLMDELEDALFAFKLDHPLLGQLAALKAIARHLRKRVPDELLEPVERLYMDLMNQLDAMARQQTDHKPGPHPAPLDRRMVDAYSAATVTVLKNCGWKVGDAITEVAKRTGLDPERLKYFRDEIHRGRADELVRKIYDKQVKRDEKSSDHFTREQRVEHALHCTQFFTVGRPFKFEFSDL